MDESIDGETVFIIIYFNADELFIITSDRAVLHLIPFEYIFFVCIDPFAMTFNL